MAISRTWNLRLNLDEFNALIASLYTDGDRALALQGLALGMNAGQCPDGAPDSFRRGWEVGSKAREATEEIRRKNAAVGALGGRPAREEKPNGLPNGSPDGKPNGDPDGGPIGEPYSRTKNEEQETKNKNPSPPAPRGGKRTPRDAFVPPTEDEAKAFAWEIGFADVARWMDHYRSNGWMVGKNQMADWKACMRNWAASRFAPPGRSGPPARSSSDQSWMERNPNAAKTYTPPEGLSNAPAW